MKSVVRRPSEGFSKFVDFVRAGYPDVAPRTGHAPLFALLRRRLSDDEVVAVAEMIAETGPPIVQTDILVAVTELVRDTCLADDAVRVSQHLADTGWLVMDTTGQPMVRRTPLAQFPHDRRASATEDAAPRDPGETDLRGRRLVERMAHLAPAVAASSGIEETFADICAAAVELIPGADLADIMLIRDGHVVSIGATAELSATLDPLQQELGEGPCAQAASDTTVVRSNDLRREERWARYAPAAVELGVQSCLSFKLYSSSQSAATMNIFGCGADVWNDEAETTGAVLAAHAAAAIASSRWGAATRSPLAERERIGQAKGIIMERYGVDDICAFTMMRRLADEAGIQLAAVAQRVIDTRTPSAL
jgi:GAF domain-containing protein